ncbi:hypothetical protein FPV67DRAFT_1008382 [Lyophyllum atratum]|nr:hypothetical protein FPV67DRAFT_1008382 [Lyophyllum atratum]
MTTWVSSAPIYHPWFTKPTAKRKLSDSPSPSTSPSPSPPSSRSGSLPPQKRPRYSALEAGFSTLTLGNPNTTDPGSSSALPYVSEPISSPSDILAIPTVVLPDTIEEPNIPEVKMKSSSWYEPEPDRIVITDLESSSDEEDNLEAEISISPALLQKISSHSRGLPEPGIPFPNQSHALILFKPLPLPLPLSGSESVPVQEDHKEETSSPDRLNIADVIEDDDAMDVEP